MFRKSPTWRKNPARSHGRRRSRVLQVESLESRRVLSTFLVTNGDDSGPGSLREALQSANAEDGPNTIMFRRGVREVGLTSGELQITDDVTIKGSGRHHLTISGEGASRVFSVLGAEASFRDLTIANGFATDTPPDPADEFDTTGFALGGGILNLRGSVHLDRVAMENNQVVGLFGFAGALGNFFSATATVKNSSFTENTANGLIAAGGAIDNDSFSTLSVARSMFANNAAIGLPTGAFPEEVIGFLGEEVLAFAGGGVAGAVKSSGGSRAEIRTSRFVANVAQAADGEGDGGNGGFYALGGGVVNQALSLFVGADFSSTTTIGHSVFVRNAALGGHGADGPDGGNGSPAAGGAVANAGNDSLLKIHHSQLRNNQAVGGDGGRASSGVGGVGGQGRGGALDNGFPSFGLGMPTLIVESSWIGHNRAVGGDGGDGSLAGNGGDGIGGAVANSSDNIELIPAGSVDVDHTALIGNSAVGGQAGAQLGENSPIFVAPVAADYEFTILEDGPLDGQGFPAGVPIPVRAEGDFTFELDPALLNDPTADSVPFTNVTGTLTGVFPEALSPFTLGPYEFIGGSLENIVRDEDGKIIAGDVVGLSMQWEQIAFLDQPQPLRVFHVEEIPFEGPIDAIPFSEGTQLAGPVPFGIYLDLGDGTGPLAATGANRTLDVIGATSAVLAEDGDGLGGAVANLDGGSARIDRGLIAVNTATGGGSGGNGQGGGIFNDVESTVELSRSRIVANRARADEGLGQGGGIYNAGSLDLDRFTRVQGNKATDDGDNLFDAPDDLLDIAAIEALGALNL